MLSEIQPYDLFHSGGVPGPAEIFSALVRAQHNESADTELLKPLSLHSATPVLPLSHFQFIPASHMRYSITLI